MATPKLKVVFLVGQDSRSTRESIESVCRLSGLELVAVLVDTDVVPFKRRRKNLLRNIRLNGWSYPAFRIVDAICTIMGRAVENAAISRDEVRRVLKKAFPETCFSLEELGKKYGMPIRAVGSLNSPEAIRALNECNADLGIVVGTRILKPTTFSVPRMGCINLHKGKVPEYRGMPPGFWEMYDGAASAGVTVHFVDQGLDTGDIIATGAVPILKNETPDTLLEKLHVEGARTLAAAVASLRDGNATRQPQRSFAGKPRSKPTIKEVASLRRRLPHWKDKGGVAAIVRNLYLLFVYYSGIYSLVRHWHRRARSRAAIFLYHRVNDYANDVLTVDTETFAAQLMAKSERYQLSSTADIVDRIYAKKPIPPTTVAIHFDDCYRDILTNGAPIMQALGVPACAFINSGYIGATRTFPHDAEKYPFTFEMLSSSEVVAWTSLGFEVGAHTVNHIDLGRCTAEVAGPEIVDCGRELQKIIGKPVDFFSFPFGRTDNITPVTRQIVETAGYTALFSAHGGEVGPTTDPHDIPRSGTSFEASPVYCLLQIEGLTLAQVAAKLRGN